jgi:hypothetical protein
VPVLSIAIVLIWHKPSSDFPDLMITPLRAATPIPDTTTIGVAITKAHGQATIMTIKPL